jgi:hypothetical protein
VVICLLNSRIPDRVLVIRIRQIILDCCQLASYFVANEEAAPLNGHSFGCLQIVADSTPRGAERVDRAKGDKLPRCTIPL